MVLPLLCVVAQLASHDRITSIMLSGDVMLNGIATKANPLALTAPIFRPASISIANLEIPLTTAKLPTPHKSGSELKSKSQFILRADPAFAKQLAASGIDMVSLGNNHCLDYRAKGLIEMQEALDRSRIVYAGAARTQDLAEAPAVYQCANGTRIALLSALAFVTPQALAHCTPATSHSAGVAVLNFGGVINKEAHERLRTWISQARSEADLVIVGLHWGIERKAVPMPYQVALGRACVDEGADVVWGNHPHVLQGSELYKSKPILYSMGNLISVKASSAGAVKLIYKGEGFVRAEFLPLTIENGKVRPISGTSAVAAKKAYINLGKLLRKRYKSDESEPLF